MIDWTKQNLVPRKGMIAWHQFEPAVSGHDVIYDYSGNNLAVACAASGSPVLTVNVLNDQPGWYFNGTSNPLAVAASILPKHIFMIVSCDESAFTAFRGLLTGVTSGDVFVSNSSGDAFVDLGFGASFSYKKLDVAFPNSDLKAPMGGTFALIEGRAPGGIALDGIQIGQQRTLTARKHKGFFIEQAMYSRILSDAETMAYAFEYVPMRYKLWPKIASGLDVFPFEPNWSQPVITDKRVLVSTSVSGAYKGRTKGSYKEGYEPRYETRWPEELDAVKSFWDSKHPGNSFIYRDYSFSPAQDKEVRFSGGISQQRNDYRDIDYSFQLETV